MYSRFHTLLLLAYALSVFLGSLVIHAIDEKYQIYTENNIALIPSTGVGLKTRQVAISENIKNVKPQNSFGLVKKMGEEAVGFYNGQKKAPQEVLTQNDSLGKAITSQRKQLALDLMKSDPEGFSQIAIKKQQWLKLPPEIQKDVEEEVTLTGELQVVHSDDFKNSANSKFEYFLNDKGKVYSLYLSRQPASRSGSKVKVQGFKLDNFLSAPGGPAPVVEIAPPPPPASVGNQRLLVLMVSQVGAPFPVFDKTTLEQIVLNGRFKSFMTEQSYDKVSFTGDVFGWLTYEGAGTCPFVTETELARFSREQGFDLANYDRLVVLVNGLRSDIGGCSTIGKNTYYIIDNNGNTLQYSLSQAVMGVGQIANINQMDFPFTWTYLDQMLSHEMGHSLGVLHANSWDCGDQVLYGNDCRHVEYGNSFDIMGMIINRFTLHFNSTFKNFLGWLPKEKILTVSKAGSYTLNRQENEVGPTLMEIKPPGFSAAPFVLEYRRPIGFDSKLRNTPSQNGVFVYRTFGGLRLLDISPLSNWDDAALLYNETNPQSFSDERKGVTIGPITELSDTSATLNVDFQPVACVRQAPGLTMLSDNPVRFYRGGLVSFRFTYINEDYDVCGSSSFSSTVSVPSGWTASAPVNSTLVPEERSYGNLYLVIPVNTPVGAYTAEIVVTNTTSGVSARVPVEIDVVDPPVIESVSPLAGPVGSATIIKGSGFVGDFSGNVAVSFYNSAGNTGDTYLVQLYDEHTIIFNIPLQARYCTWADPQNPCSTINTPDGDYMLFVSANGSASGQWPFTISSAKPAVVYPNGGEKWQVGETYTIQYDLPTPSHKALIYLQQYHPEGATKTGVNSSRLIGEPAVGVKSFSYKVDDPAMFGTSLGDRFKISVCASTCALRDSSDGFFSIVNQGVASLTRVGADNQPSSAPAGTTATLETTTIALNPARFYGLDSTLGHKAYFTDLPGYTETAGACNYAVGSSECTVTDYTTLPLCNGSTCFVGFSVTDGMVTKINTRYIAGSFTRISSQSTDYTSVGIGMGTTNSGSIKLSGISGTVKKALLIWNSVGNLTSAPTQNVTVTKLSVVPDGSSNTITLTGNNLGTSGPNNTGTKYSRTYVADISSFVRSNGDYQVSDFGQSSSLNPDGASLIVLFDDGNNANNRSITLVAGNDSNCSNTRDASGWNVAISNVMYVSGTANLEIHAGDGQSTGDASLALNNTTIQAAGNYWTGATVPGGKWDKRLWDISSRLTAGVNTLTTKMGSSGDCVSFVAGVINVPAPVSQ